MKKTTLNNILFSILQQVVTVLCGFIIPRLIIQSYGSSVNGVISSITQFLGYITLLEAGMSPVVKAALYKPIVNCEQEKIKNILKTAEKFFRRIAIIFIIYLVVLSIVFANFYKEEYDYLFTISLVAIISISTFFEYFFGMTYRVYLQAQQRTYVIAIIKIITKILNTILIVFLIFNNCSVQIVKLISSLIFILVPLFQNFYVKKKFKISLKGVEGNFKLENKWAGLSQHIATIIHNSVDVCVLTFFTNSLEVSVYSIYMLVINSMKELSISLAGGIDALFGNIFAKGNKEYLSKKFKVYEAFYFTIITIMFACTFVLIVPFIKVYTNGISDVNYIRPTFAIIMVLAELVMAIRVPYNNLVLGAGHLKQTSLGAWIEVGTNVIISVACVFKFGIIGVAIGTLISMIIRTAEYIFYCCKHLLNKSLFKTLKKIAIVILEFVAIILLSNLLPEYTEISYLSWIKYAIIVGAISISVVLPVNLVVYKKEFKEILKYIKEKR